LGLGKNTELIVVFLAVLVLFVGINSFEDVEAMKSKGTHLTETTSKQVCGNFLCDEPLSIAEKIAAYLLNLALEEEPETNVLHQAFIPGSFGGERMAPPISPIGEISFQVPDLKMAASQIGAKTFKSLDVKQAAPRDVKALKLARDLIQKFDLKQERLLPTVAKVAENFQPSLDRDKITQIRIAQKELEKFKPKISEFKDFELKENVSTETYPLTMTQEQENIPSWIKEQGKWWVEGSISGGEFINSVQYMIKENIMVIPDLPEEVTQMELKDEKRAMGMEREQNVPDWIRNNAGWWADGLISDDDFVSGIKYLVEQGIIRI